MNKKIIDVKYAGTFTAKKHQSSNDTYYNIDHLLPGYNFTDKHIIKLSPDKKVDWITSRICDHANGTLEKCNKEHFAQCPLHGWELNLEELHYSNVNVKKDILDFKIKNNSIVIEEKDTYLQFPIELYKKQSEEKLNIRFIAHACLLFTCGDINIMTDPWLKGPCFLNGWWHKPAPSDDALDQLLKADLVYISHNHPDHMHEESLRHLHSYRPDIPIIIPNFKSKSAELPLKNIGFTNVIPLAFNQIYKINDSDIFISILKSGDFRDDSGLYLSYGKKQALITVDSSALNHFILPYNIDFLATSFAAGASGHPWCFDHYDFDKKQEIMMNRHKSVMLSILKCIDVCQPKSYMPYAGYFSEDAPRDDYIKQHNKKNSSQDVQKLIASKYPDVKYIDPITNDTICINESISLSKSITKRLTHAEIDTIDLYLSQETIPSEEVFFSQLKKYFDQSQFSDNLILYLIPCDDDFNDFTNSLITNFNNPSESEIHTSKKIRNLYENSNSSQRHLLIQVRAKSLWQVIEHHKSWEELSIGFHCRIHRKPDVYNSDFWYHFSNIYIK